MSDFQERISKLSPARLALLAVDLQSRLEALEGSRREPIAVIGIGCRFPGGASGPESFWRLLRSGTDAVAEMPAERFDLDAFYDPNPDAPGKLSTRQGGFLGPVDGFDPEFFGISPREALSMDPQQRLLLEVAWEALEHAGQSPEALHGTRTGVFLGMSATDYYLEMLLGEDAGHHAYLATGNARSVASGRISYLLGLRGPSLAVDTACSSSLVAVHLACQSLRSGGSRMALAAGVNLILSPDITITLSKAHMLAPDGRCKTFDSAADGFGRGEGCGVVVLKRLSDAIADGDRVLAVIRGSAVNQDGRSSGLTAPNGPAQEDVIREALADAGIEPSEVGYIEAHGTGTSLGDPIEVRALGAVLGAARATPLLLGSVKTNIAHLEAAAGVAGLIKVVLSLQHREIPPHLHLRKPNSHIAWDELPVAIPTVPTPWPAIGGRFIAGLSSFGFSGTNAHVVLEAAPATTRPRPERERPLHLLTVSARSPRALGELAELYAVRVQETGDETLADVAFTANSGRSHLPYRLAVRAASNRELADGLRRGTTGADPGPGVWTGHVPGSGAPEVAFLFTGQGSQYAGMGRDLFLTQPTFRRALERCDEILRPRLERPLLSVLYPEPGQATPLDETAYTQPALFALEYALAELWRSFGVLPSVVMGHSVGEYVAACVAGVFTLEEGLGLIAERGRLMQALPRGGEMAAVFVDEARVKAALVGHGRAVSIAAVNGPDNVVISGEARALETVLASLRAEGVKSKGLTVSHAFHSPLMDPILDVFEAEVGRISLKGPRTGLVSNLSGALAGRGEVETAGYWRRHLREPVRFSDGMRVLAERGSSVFVEIGPGTTLLGMGRRCVERESDAWLSSLRKGRGDWEQILESLAGLYVRGVAVDFKGFDRDYPRQKVALPTYPFERERYWVPARRGAPRPASAPQADRPAFADWLYETVWREAPLATHAVLPRTPVAVTAERPSIAAGRWIVLADEGGVGEALAARLREDGDDCTMVRTADRSEVSALGTVRIDPARPEEFRRLVQEIGSESWKGAVHLWGLDAPGADMPLALLDAEARVCGSLLHLVQAMVGAGRRGLCAVTRGAQRTEPGEAVVSVVPATLWGLGKVVALEHPGLASVCVDLDPAIGSAAAADLLFDELTHPDGEDQVAVRGGERRVARLARMEPASGTPSPSFAAAGTYLITGGLSGLGLLVARWMVTRGARHLVLLGRRGATEAAGPVLCEIEAAGAEVRSFAGDVADESRVRAILGEIDRSMPPLRGVVHAAGVLDDAVLEHQDWSRFERVLAPKVLGGWILHELTRTRPLDFFVLFSSGASLIGSPGQGNHAAANAFLDALAHHRRGLDLPALSINWGAWAEVGAAADRGLSVWMARRGMNGIAPHEGLDALGHLMSGGAAQVGVLNLDWAVLSSNLALASRFYSEMASPVAATGAQVVPGAPGARVDLLTRLEQARPAKRRAILCERVRGEAMKVLGLGPGRTLEADRPMQELGLDSLMAVELRNALGAALGRTLPAALLFDYPTLDRVVDYLLTEVLALVGSADVGEAAPASAPMSSESEALDDLSVDEMAALLAKRLDDVGEDRSR